MAHAFSQVRFADWLILFGQFNDGESRTTTSRGYFCSRLHLTSDDVYRLWHEERNDQAKCTCGRDEEVILATNAAGGFAVEGRACRHCLTITFDPFPDLVFVESKIESGLPWWWVIS